MIVICPQNYNVQLQLLGVYTIQSEAKGVISKWNPSPLRWNNKHLELWFTDTLGLAVTNKQ